MILVGELALWVALLLAAWGAIVSFAGGASGRTELIASGGRASYATFACVVLAIAGLVVALVTSDFSFRYVASFTSDNLPVAYKLIALWGGPSGSLLFLTLLLSMFAAMAVATNRARNHTVIPYVAGTLSLVILFFLAAICFSANPYERLAITPPDGRGMNPHLQHPGMAVHPPALYLGYVATTIPFAFAIGALLDRKLDSAWTLAVRRWSLVAWVFLTIGMITGMWWAYLELGWGGAWAWDPVNNRSVLPWLAATALLQVSLRQEKRDTPWKGTMGLALSSFLLALFGAFLEGGGMISRMHTFAQSEARYWFAGFLTVAVAVVGYLIVTGGRELQAMRHAQSLEGEGRSVPVNDLLLVATTFSLLWGTLFPVLREAAREGTIIPLGLLLLALTAVGPLIAWRRTPKEDRRRQFSAPIAGAMIAVIVAWPLGVRDGYSLIAFSLAGFVLTPVVQEFARRLSTARRMTGQTWPGALLDLVTRSRRRYGGYFIRVGVIALAIAFAGFAFRTHSDVSLSPGEAATLVDPFGRHWSFTSQGVSEFEQLNRQVVAVAVQATRDGAPVGLIRSEQRQYVDSRGGPTFEPSTEGGIDYSLRQDTHVVLAKVSGDRANLRIAFKPLVALVWIGAALVTVGGTIVMWPLSERRV